MSTTSTPAQPTTSAAPTRRTSGTRRHRTRRQRREARVAALFLAPDAVGLLVFVAVPMLLSVVLGFFWIDGFGNFDFIGIQNYV